MRFTPTTMCRLTVNEGHNQELLQQCSLLQQYAQYVSKVRQYAAAMPLNQAVEQAVNECIQAGILTEFLSRNRSEVISMSIFEYDKELEEKKIRKAEYEFGFAEGIEKGIEKGRAEGIEKGRATGVIETGYDFGLSDGKR